MRLPNTVSMMLTAGLSMPGARKRYWFLGKINIEKECELIKQKKSKLSANERKIVIEEYERFNK